MTTCSQKDCDKPATWSYVWPNDPDRKYACDRHKQAAINVSEAMGFHLGDMRKEETDGDN